MSTSITDCSSFAVFLATRLGCWSLEPSHHALASLWGKILTRLEGGGGCCRASLRRRWPAECGLLRWKPAPVFRTWLSSVQ